MLSREIEFGEYLKKIRKSKKMTIRQLELYSGVSNAYISQLERADRGIPTPDILRKLSKGLNHDYNDLMIKAGYIEVLSEGDNEEKTKEDEIRESKLKVVDEIMNLPEDKRKIIEDLLRTFKNDQQ